jgi:hypothetical protein
VVSRLRPLTGRPVRTRFPFGSAPEALNLASDRKSPDHYSKGTPSSWPCGHRTLRACRHAVSGSLSSPRRGSSHLSFALLGSLSVAREYLALRDGPRGFEPAFTCLALLRCRMGAFAFRLRGSHPLRPPIPEGSAGLALHGSGPTTPPGQVRVVWAGPLSLAATDGVDFSFSYSRY